MVQTVAHGPANNCTERPYTEGTDIHTLFKSNVKNNCKTTIPTFKVQAHVTSIEIETFPYNQTIPKFFTLTPLQTLGARTLSDPHSCSLFAL